MKKVKTAILISGRGSNMKNLIEHVKNNDSKAEISLVISNKIDALGLEFAKQNDIKTQVIEHKNYKNREEFDEIMVKTLQENNIELVCLAGFMRLITNKFIEQFENRIINIHPSFLPNFKGAHAVKDALEAGAEFSGCTTHFVIEKMDAGKIILQEKVKIDKNDDFESLAAKILEKEHEIYPKTLEIVCEKILNHEI